MNPSNTYYDVVMFDFHGVLTSNVGRTTHALVNAAQESGLKTNQIRKLLLGLLNRPRGIDARSFLKKNAGENVGQAYGRKAEEVYVPQYSWIIRRTKELGPLTAIVSNGKMRDIFPHIQKWNLLRYLDGVYARGLGGNLGDQIRKKPNPKALEVALDDILSKNEDRQINRALYIGDYDSDVIAANSINFEHNTKKVEVNVAYLLGGPEQHHNISVMPTFFLSLHHLKLTREKNILHGLPLMEFRSLPEIIKHGPYNGNGIESLKNVGERL